MHGKGATQPTGCTCYHHEPRSNEGTQEQEEMGQGDMEESPHQTPPVTKKLKFDFKSFLTNTASSVPLTLLIKKINIHLCFCVYFLFIKINNSWNILEHCIISLNLC